MRSGMSRLTKLKDATVGSTLLDRQYSYNTVNQISAITEPSRTRAFGYDNINRLTSATDSHLVDLSKRFGTCRSPVGRDNRYPHSEAIAASEQAVGVALASESRRMSSDPSGVSFGAGGRRRSGR